MKSVGKKLTIVWSPCGGVGKTTIASFLSVASANKGNLIALIELNRYCASSPYLLNTLNNEKSLKKAIDEDDERYILKNFVQSSNNERLFTLSLNTANTLDDLAAHEFTLKVVQDMKLIISMIPLHAFIIEFVETDAVI
ncbi:UNVERIFIED_CONTAM: AAA domain-containing protein [Acetivibrio alkalicellulosi]